MTRRRTSFEMDRAYRACLPGFGPDGYPITQYIRLDLMEAAARKTRALMHSPVGDDEAVNDGSDDPDED